MSFQTPNGYFTGKKDPVPSAFDEFKSYLPKDLTVSPPTSAHYGSRVKVPWQMDANGPDPTVTIAPAGWSGCGDCTEAAKGHALTLGNYLPNVETSVPVPTGNAIVQQYCIAQNCTPAQLFADPNKYDLGEDISTTLTTWCTTEEYGVILPFTAPVNEKSKQDIMDAIWLCGCLDIGIQLPSNAESEFPNEWTWDPSASTIGGHCVLLTGYTESYVALVTWGRLIQATWEFVLNTIDEAHALILPQSNSAGMSPTGLLIDKWKSDLANVAS